MEQNEVLDVYVLMRGSKKTGKIDMTMTAMGKGLLQGWALQNTPKTKMCLIFNRRTGECVFATYGQDGGFPKVKKKGKDDMPNCDDFGISLEDLQSITDDRFDKEEGNA